MSRVHNFGAGPAKLPNEVYEQIRTELTDWEGSGISVLETSHRSPAYLKLNTRVQQLVRQLLEVPDNYRILLLSGGGQGEFAAVPLNLMSRTGTADYIITGAWSQKAAAEARKFGAVRLVTPTPADRRFTDVPERALWQLDPNASYVHICVNETIHGVEWDSAPDTGSVPLVADMSSCIMSRQIDVSKYGVIYAGAQKNVGTAGVAVVIVREDLLGSAAPACPSILDWTINVKHDSILNTPPVFPIYVLGAVLEWIVREGGVREMEARARRKAEMLYGAIDQSAGFYSAPVAARARSRMNVPFRVYRSGAPDPALEAEFLRGAEERKLIQLKGHRDVGGLRASLYNAVTLEDVEVLVQYMSEFRALATSA